jgi:hypothetical protein
MRHLRDERCFRLSLRRQSGFWWVEGSAAAIAPMTFRSIWISDIHLGSKHAQVDALLASP